VNATIYSCWPVTIMVMVLAAPARASDDFEKHVRPLLVEKCQSCHGAEKQKGGLRLDSRAALLKGGESNRAVGLWRLWSMNRAIFRHEVRRALSTICYTPRLSQYIGRHS